MKTISAFAQTVGQEVQVMIVPTAGWATGSPDYTDEQTLLAIRAAAANLNLKSDRYEWQVRQFVQSLLTLIGHPTGDIRFNRQCIANESEVVRDIAAMRDDIDLRTALRLNPYIQEEEIEELLHDDAQQTASPVTQPS
jgi:hypothetical protein